MGNGDLTVVGLGVEGKEDGGDDDDLGDKEEEREEGEVGEEGNDDGGEIFPYPRRNKNSGVSEHKTAFCIFTSPIIIIIITIRIIIIIIIIIIIVIRNIINLVMLWYDDEDEV